MNASPPSDHPRSAQRRRRPTVLAASLALTTAATLTATGVIGWSGSQNEAQATTVSQAWPTEADGFASVNAMDQNGTYGGRDGETVTVTTEEELVQYATAEEPYTIRVAGSIAYSTVGEEIEVASDKTIVGVGTSGEIVGGGFFLGEGVHNVIIRNLTIRDTYQGQWDDNGNDFDAIQMDGAHHVWIDHNNLTRMADGLIDSRKDTTYLTVSYNRLSENNKTFGIGWTDNVSADITIHHNWFYETEQRNPSADNIAHAHLYNNYLQDDPAGDVESSYGNYARGATSMVLENSYFEGVNDPFYPDPEAQLVERGSVLVDTTGRAETQGEAFDPSEFYDYTLDPAEDLPALLSQETGPQADIGGEPQTLADITVAQDGSGDYTTVQAAIDAVPEDNDAVVTIDVAPGTYRELVVIPSNKPHIRLNGTGSGPQDVTIVYNNSAGTESPEGGEYGTSGSATFMADADDFQASNLTIANDFDENADDDGEGLQAVALRTRGDQIVLDNIITTGDQDTLLLDSADREVQGRVYITDSTIQGNVDFIFGRATAVITNSVIEVTKRWDGSSGGYVTAPSTAPEYPGFLIINSTITGDVEEGTFYLGRPWHAGGDADLDPQTIVRDTELSGAVKGTPWTDMSGFPWQEDRFAEYQNTGPGSGPASDDRPHLTDEQATDYEIADWLGDWTP